jgi:hypothetical protein
MEYDEYKKMIIESKFNCIVYYPYDTISNLLLFEYINEIRKIGFITKNNYYRMIVKICYQYSENITYKIKMFNVLIEVWKTYLPQLTFDMDVYDMLDELDELVKSDESDESNELDELDELDEFDSLVKSDESVKSDKTHEQSNSQYKKKITINYEIFKESINIIYDGYFISHLSSDRYKYDSKKLSNIVNGIFKSNKKFIELTKNDLKEKISHLLTNSNIHSFGLILIDYLNNNMDKIGQSVNIEKILKQFIEVIINCCLNCIIIEDKIYLLDRNYSNIEKILKNN